MPNSDLAILDEVDRLLAPYGGRKLYGAELSKYKSKKYVSGWEFPTSVIISDQYVELRILFQAAPNLSIPDIFIANPITKPLSFPHLESNGKLCVWPSRNIADLHNLDYLIELVSDAVELLRKSTGGELDEEFLSEFESYWCYHCNDLTHSFSLIDPHRKQNRRIYCYQLPSRAIVFADNKATLINWLDNQGKLPPVGRGKARKARIEKIASSAVIFFDTAIYPNEYPRTASDLFDLIRREYGEEATYVLELVAKSVSQVTVAQPELLLSFNTDNGRCLVGLKFQRNIHSRFNRTAAIDGFRDRVPFNVLLNRVSNFKVSGKLIERADDSWVFGRDSNPGHKRLSEHKVAIVGCGSIGSSISRLLIKSGVSFLTLIDGECLETANIARHELGFDDNFQSKAKGLEKKLKREFPNTKIESVTKKFYLSDAFSDELDSVDVVLSTSSDWYAEQQLLTLQKRLPFVLVFAFVEAHAMAGHVIVNMPDDDAFNSLHFRDGPNVGKLKEPVTQWDNETVVKIPACAGEFQPYGAIDIGFVHSLAARKISNLLLSDNPEDQKSSWSVWFNATQDIETLGGKWNTEWEKDGFAIGSGLKVLEREYIDGTWKNLTYGD